VVLSSAVGLIHVAALQEYATATDTEAMMTKIQRELLTLERMLSEEKAGGGFKAQKQTGGSRWCQHCQQHQPKSSNHCRDCGVCVTEYDHHCPFMSQCVGGGNITSFYTFLLSCIVVPMGMFVMLMVIEDEKKAKCSLTNNVSC
jgi:hypothetical protein